MVGGDSQLIGGTQVGGVILPQWEPSQFLPWENSPLYEVQQLAFPHTALGQTTAVQKEAEAFSSGENTF